LFKPTFKKTSIRIQKRKKERGKVENGKERRKKDGKWKVEKKERKSGTEKNERDKVRIQPTKKGLVSKALSKLYSSNI